MTQNKIYTDTIKKPSRPHRTVTRDEMPTKEEIQKRLIRIERMKRLGIGVNTLDGNDDEYEEDLDKLEASILIMQDKEIPKELERKILAKLKSSNDKAEKNNFMEGDAL